MQLVDSVWAPQIICDTCNRSIEFSNGDGAKRTRPEIIAIWSLAPGEGVRRRVLHVHKGKCDATARRFMKEPVAFEELPRHLIYLCRNANFPPAQLALAEKEVMA